MIPTVSVLLSTYNGHKYLRELVDSVLTQEKVNVYLQVRDDGSTDDTIRILKSYNDSRISVKAGENLKPAQSFLKLLRECEASEYYAYCDQDDVWYPNKLITSVMALREYKEPALFISTYDVTDEKLNKMFTRDMHYDIPLRLQDTIIYRAPSACNMVFNHALREVINRAKPNFARMHDFWTLLVAESHDYAIITASIPLMKYRQHNEEAVGIIPSFSIRIKRLFNSFFKGNNERWRQIKELYDFYKDEIPIEQNKILETLINYRDSFSNRIKLIRDKRFDTGDCYINSLFKFAVLLGKF